MFTSAAYHHHPYQTKVDVLSSAFTSGYPHHHKSRFQDYTAPPLGTAHVPIASAAGSMGALLLDTNRHTTSSSASSPQHATKNVSPRMTDSPSGSESMDGSSVMDHGCHTGGGSTRKRRRGVIEKRRRDRINNSLAELRRLVPSAFEKQGSTKLEKAEILQMTVDHLKTIHTKGMNYASNGLDPHMLGFQECVAEIQRFIVQDEHFSAQDQLRNRLISHLQCYTAQRESFKHSSSQSSHHLHPAQYYPTGPTGLVPPAPPVGPQLRPGIVRALLLGHLLAVILRVVIIDGNGFILFLHADFRIGGGGAVRLPYGGQSEHAVNVPSPGQLPSQPTISALDWPGIGLLNTSHKMLPSQSPHFDLEGRSRPPRTTQPRAAFFVFAERQIIPI